MNILARGGTVALAVVSPGAWTTYGIDVELTQPHTHIGEDSE
jgi:hypothetical protein